MDCRNLTQFLLPCLKRVAVEPGLHEISFLFHMCLSLLCVCATVYQLTVVFTMKWHG